MKPIEIDLFILYDNLGGYHMYLYPLLRIHSWLYPHPYSVSGLITGHSSLFVGNPPPQASDSTQTLVSHTLYPEGLIQLSWTVTLTITPPPRI